MRSSESDEAMLSTTSLSESKKTPSTPQSEIPIIPQTWSELENSLQWTTLIEKSTQWKNLSIDKKEHLDYENLLHSQNLELAEEEKQQRLDDFFQYFILPLYQNAKATLSQDKKNLLHWATLCQQPLYELIKLAVRIKTNRKSSSESIFNLFNERENKRDNSIRSPLDYIKRCYPRNPSDSCFYKDSKRDKTFYENQLRQYLSDIDHKWVFYFIGCSPPSFSSLFQKFIQLDSIFYNSDERYEQLGKVFLLMTPSQNEYNKQSMLFNYPDIKKAFEYCYQRNQEKNFRWISCWGIFNQSVPCLKRYSRAEKIDAVQAALDALLIGGEKKVEFLQNITTDPKLASILSGGRLGKTGLFRYLQLMRKITDPGNSVTPLSSFAVATLKNDVLNS